MEIKAKLSNLRIAPRKARLVADMVRMKNVGNAQAILSFTVKKASLPILKLLNSAVANAKSSYQLNADNLYISKITVDEGPKFKRWMPRARGRAAEIQKKTSHITIILEEINPGEKKEMIENKEVAGEKEVIKEKKEKTRKTGTKRITSARPKKVLKSNRMFRRKSV